MSAYNWVPKLLILTLMIAPTAHSAELCSSVFKGDVAGNVAVRTAGPSYKDYQIDPMLQMREHQKQNVAGVLKGTEATPDLATAFAALKDDFLLNRNVVLGQLPSQMLRLVDYDAYKSFKKEHENESTMKIYGVETMRAWKEADDFLAGIPIGKLDITPELIQKVASYSSRDLRPLPVNIPHVTPQSGKFKILPNSGRAPLYEPLSEEQYQILKQNKEISGFIEMPAPWSKPGARRGIILYALPHTVPKKLATLVKWYNENKETMDPVRLATEFQRSFISIHPLVDGNGRCSRLLMDRILLEHGLPPALLLDHNMDLYTDIDVYTNAVRAGIADTINLLQDENYTIQAGSRLTLGLSSLDAYGEIMKSKEARAAVKTYNELRDFHFQVADRTFKLESDGFFYDQYAIPHEYNDGTFYPIADRMTELYDFGGNVKSYQVRHQRYSEWTPRTPSKVISEYFTTENLRSFSDLKKGVFQKHMRIAEKIKAGQIATSGLKALPVTTVKKANENSDLLIYPWQQDQFIAAFTPKTEDPLQSLAPFFDADTTYYDILRSGKKPSASLTLSQYEHVDLVLYDYAIASRGYPKLFEAIQKQRSLIHSVARERMNSIFADYDKLAPEQKAQAEKDFRFNLFKTYLGISKLKYKTLDQAIAAGADKYVPLLRNANRANTKFGFIPIPVYKKALSRIPFFNSMIEWARVLSKEMSQKGEQEVLTARINDVKWLPAKVKAALLKKIESQKGNIQQGLSTFVNDMLMVPGTQTPYSLAGNREAYLLQNRAAGGDADEGGLSFSTSPDLYFSGSVFATGDGAQVAVHVLKAPRKSVIQNFVSTFKNEYEVIGNKAIFATAIVKAFDGNEMKKHESFPKNDLGRVMRDMLGISPSTASGEIELETPAAEGAQAAAPAAAPAACRDGKCK